MTRGARPSLFEFRLERDENLLNGDQLARIIYRRNGVRRWSKFVVVLDDETTFETVKANAEHLIVLYEARS
jgi:hypothetical protein